MSAVHRRCRRLHDPILDLVPPQGLRLTPRHYAYLKISEGCNNRCSLLHHPLAPRRSGVAVRPPRARRGGAAGAGRRQGAAGHLARTPRPMASTSATPRAGSAAARCGPGSSTSAAELGPLGVWVRLHYVYPYPHVDDVLPLMAEGKILPYLDIPFQHASAPVLKAMRRPAKQEQRSSGSRRWREDLPRPRHPLHLHRRLPRRDRGGLPLSARLAEGGEDRARRLLQIRAGGRRRRQRPRRRRPRGGQGGALAPFDGGAAGDLGRDHGGEGRPHASTC